MRVVYWGTYDLGKPRNRILIEGLRQNDVEVIECHKNLWSGIEDKSQFRGLIPKLKKIVFWLLSYPGLIYQYLKISKNHDCIIVGYLGHLDVIILWPFAKIKKKKIIWDAFISLYDTVVEDRCLIGSKNPLAKILFFFELVACKAADYVLLDTETHANYFKDKYRLSEKKCGAVFVGVESDMFSNDNKIEAFKSKKSFNILFYGQFIPLHGIETIIKAAAILKHHLNLTWTLIGTGQEAQRINQKLVDLDLKNLDWIQWVSYAELKNKIYAADICLGIFGTSDKASRVIPNKVFQIISCGKTLITRDSPAIRELFPKREQGLTLIPPGDPMCLADAILDIINNKEIQGKEPYFRSVQSQITPEGVGCKLKERIIELV